jgi:hypothetical protein
MKFPSDLFARVRGSLERAGFCFLSYDEIERLLASVPGNRYTRHRALLEFAELCGAEVETTIHLKSARFVLGGAIQQDSAPPALPRTAATS